MFKTKKTKSSRVNTDAQHDVKIVREFRKRQEGNIDSEKLENVGRYRWNLRKV